MKPITWPAWFNSPDGSETAIFTQAEDVPSGWTSGAEKQPAEAPAKVEDAPKRGRPTKPAKPAEDLDL